MSFKIFSAVSLLIFGFLGYYGFDKGENVILYSAIAGALVQLYLLVKSFMKKDVKKSSKSDTLNERIQNVLLKAANGNFEDRITNIDDNSPYAKSAWALNDLLDQLEAFERDIKESINAAKNGIDYRDIAPQGYKGTFRRTVVMLNSAIDAISTALKEQARSELAMTLNNLNGGIKTQINEIKVSLDTKLKEFMIKIDELSGEIYEGADAERMRAPQK